MTTTIDQALAQWRLWSHAAAHSERTITERERILGRLTAAGHDPLTITGPQLVEWFASQDVARSSLATYRSQLTAWYTWAVEHGHRPDNPTDALPPIRPKPGQPRPLTRDQVAALLHHTHGTITHEYITVACYQGLRNHETAKIHARDVGADTLRVVGKGGSDYTLPLHPKVAEIAAEKPAGEYWFPGRVGGHVTAKTVGNAIKRAMTECGIDATPHACRHYYGTQVLAASGGNLRVTQAAMRHSSVSSTAIYTGISDTAVADAIRGA